MLESAPALAPRLSVSTWSLHRSLGSPAFYPAGQTDIPTDTHGRGALTLLELPARIAAFGIHTLEICHFHLPSRSASYLDELRAALQEAEVELFSFLVDDGDLTNPQTAEQDLAWMRAWVPVAAQLGARRMRVIAGKAAASEETLATSERGLRLLASDAQAHGIRLMTENWFGLLNRPAEVEELLNRMEGQLGLCLDFGNWRGLTKYADLATIATRAESCHAKAHFSAPEILDREDFEACVRMMRAATFRGPYTLIYDGPGNDEWAGLAIERDIVNAINQ